MSHNTDLCLKVCPVHLCLHCSVVVVCSWDEMANYDLPAMLNYVLNMTGHEKLSYVGHSQGTLIAFARLSHDRVLANKVALDFFLMTLSSLHP